MAVVVPDESAGVSEGAEQEATAISNTLANRIFRMVKKLISCRKYFVRNSEKYG